SSSINTLFYVSVKPGTGQYEAAVEAARRFPKTVSLNDMDVEGDRGVASRALNGLLEMVFAGALHADVSEATDRLGQSSTAIVLGWPAAAIAVRELFDSYVRKTIPHRNVGFWKQFVWLRGCA
ncbi:MAG: hypothetical protein QM645_08160, partial [Asticcacaulis sp.]